MQTQRKPAHRRRSSSPVPMHSEKMQHAGVSSSPPQSRRSAIASPHPYNVSAASEPQYWSREAWPSPSSPDNSPRTTFAQTHYTTYQTPSRPSPHHNKTHLGRARKQNTYSCLPETGSSDGVEHTRASPTPDVARHTPHHHRHRHSHHTVGGRDDHYAVNASLPIDHPQQPPPPFSHRSSSRVCRLFRKLESEAARGRVNLSVACACGAPLRHDGNEHVRTAHRHADLSTDNLSCRCSKNHQAGSSATKVELYQALFLQALSDSAAWERQTHALEAAVEAHTVREAKLTRQLQRTRQALKVLAAYVEGAERVATAVAGTGCVDATSRERLAGTHTLLHHPPHEVSATRTSTIAPDQPEEEQERCVASGRERSPPPRRLPSRSAVSDLVRGSLGRSLELALSSSSPDADLGEECSDDDSFVKEEEDAEFWQGHRQVDHVHACQSAFGAVDCRNDIRMPFHGSDNKQHAPPTAHQGRTSRLSRADDTRVNEQVSAFPDPPALKQASPQQSSFASLHVDVAPPPSQSSSSSTAFASPTMKKVQELSSRQQLNVSTSSPVAERRREDAPPPASPFIVSTPDHSLAESTTANADAEKSKVFSKLQGKKKAAVEENPRYDCSDEAIARLPSKAAAGADTAVAAMHLLQLMRPSSREPAATVTAKRVDETSPSTTTTTAAAAASFLSDKQRTAMKTTDERASAESTKPRHTQGSDLEKQELRGERTHLPPRPPSSVTSQSRSADYEVTVMTDVAKVEKNTGASSASASASAAAAERSRSGSHACSSMQQSVGHGTSSQASSPSLRSTGTPGQHQQQLQVSTPNAEASTMRSKAGETPIAAAELLRFLTPPSSHPAHALQRTQPQANQEDAGSGLASSAGHSESEWESVEYSEDSYTSTSDSGSCTTSSDVDDGSEGHEEQMTFAEWLALQQHNVE